MRGRRFVLAAAAAMAVLAAPAGARAQTESSDAEAALQHGVELRKEGKDQEALRAFRHAYELEPSPRARAQIGLAELALGRWVDAEADLEEAMRAAQDPWIARYEQPLDEALAHTRARLGWLEVASNVAGAELWIDGKRIGALPLAAPARVVAGSVVIEVRAPGYVTVKRPIDVAAGAHARESVTLVPVETTPPPGGPVVVVGPASQARGDGSTLRMLAIVTAGVGAIGLGTGAIFGLQTFSKKSDRDAHCTAAGCDALGLSLDHDARRDATISTIGFGVGLAAIAGSVALFVASSSSSSPRAGAVRVSPALGGLQMEGAF